MGVSAYYAVEFYSVSMMGVLLGIDARRIRRFETDCLAKRQKTINANDNEVAFAIAA